MGDLFVLHVLLLIKLDPVTCATSYGGGKSLETHSLQSYGEIIFFSVGTISYSVRKKSVSCGSSGTANLGTRSDVPYKCSSIIKLRYRSSDRKKEEKNFYRFFIFFI